MKVYTLFFSLILLACKSPIQELPLDIPQHIMEEVYEEVKTPFKYGVVFQHPDSTKMIDSPTVFRENGLWYMTYIVFDGQGYETWLAQSEDLLHWKSKGRILSFTEGTWDANQKAGYPALVNTEWGGDYSVEKFQGKYWMTYLGGSSSGYEAGTLKVGLASAAELTATGDWDVAHQPLLSPEDGDVRWFEDKTIYKSHVIRDSEQLTGYPFVMYYNAKGDTADYESIGMAVSQDLKTWKRFGEDPVITRYQGICGDAQVVQFGDMYVMFYFGAFWKPGAFERFAVSYDLVHWTDWNGPDLISPSESFDLKYAHKPWVIRWNGVVYHFYNAVGDRGRVIALATSEELKK
ncbi:hypothetical protein GCM10009119_22890 [Algoriphagus jejuensis]|uniref:Glycosylase n=1 Tax=Algoriphagus jejuensis TaxID=419934 RepID=A0ABP3YF84_9BACT